MKRPKWSPAIHTGPVLALFTMVLSLLTPTLASAETLALLTAYQRSDPPYYPLAASGVWLGISAVLRDDLGSLLGGLPIAFDDPDNTGKLTFSSSMELTVNGQAAIKVRGNGSTGTVTVRATYLNSGGTVIHATVPITLEADTSQPIHETPEIDPLNPNYQRQPNPCDITYWYRGGLFYLQINMAMTSWQGTGRVKFRETFGDFMSKFQIYDQCAPDASWIGRTVALSGIPGGERIDLNCYYLAGGRQDPQNPCQSDYPPRDDNLVLWTASHEEGHGLNLDENAQDRISLMWQGIDSYYACGTLSPTNDETQRIHDIYLNPCGP